MPRWKFSGMSEPAKLLKFDCIKEGSTIVIIVVFNKPEITRAEAYKILSEELLQLADKRP